MTDQSSIFENSNSGGNPTIDPQGGAGTPSNVQIDPAIITLLGEIKNDRGEPKYKSLPEALNALKHSQEYIPQLTAQLSQKETDLIAARASADKVAELERSIEALTRPQGTPQNTTQAALTEEQIAELVNRTLTKTQKQAVENANLSSVANTLKEAFGTEAETKYNAKAAELGMSVPEFNALAARSPKAVLEMLGAKAVPTTPSNPSGTVNTTGLQPHQDTFIGRNKKSVLIGATTADMQAEREASKKMVTELESKGMSIDDLTNPKNYFKYFGN